MSTKWFMTVDIAKCNGCYNCFIAAKDEYVDNAEPGYFAAQPRHGQAWIDLQHVERGTVPLTDAAFVPVMCNHCDDAPCMKAAKNGAVVKRKDGIVLIVPEKAKGQKAIADACPYNAVFWNEEAQLPQAWPFDAHLLDRGWDRPRCVQTCATGALTVQKIDDATMARQIAEQGLKPLRPDLNTKPRVYYRNLDRAHACFIGGTVFAQINGQEECAEGARVVIEGAGQRHETVTDAFGEFKVDGFAADSGAYRVTISLGDQILPPVTVTLGRSVVLPPVRLAP